ncbi:hypothetical protein TNCV_904961 [Trichonephila clavipes]|nr:hypothetical protein TNCV_904961 [Trichonephila clavipes]
MFERVSAMWDCSTVLSEESVAADDDNVRTAPIMPDKGLTNLSRKIRLRHKSDINRFLHSFPEESIESGPRQHGRQK